MNTDERQICTGTRSAKVSYCGANQETADPKRPTAQESFLLNHRVIGLDVGS